MKILCWLHKHDFVVVWRGSTRDAAVLQCDRCQAVRYRVPK